LAPLVDVINKEFKISKAMFTTVHAYTNDQTIHDESHKKLRRGRAAFLNMIPTSTGANEAVASVLPELLGKIKGLAVRVPIAVGSLLDLVAEVKTKADAKKVNSVLKKYSEGKLKGIMQYSEDELVSSDIIGNSNSCIIDALNTQVEGDLIKVIAWYDNEYGYSCRVADVIGMIENIGK
jgi:glyceraldehyde 3-phosphate dehydrogenase